MTNKCPVHGLEIPWDEEYYEDPYALYAKLHGEGPVHRVCYPGGDPVWLVTRYEDVLLGLKDKRLVRAREHAGDHYTNTRFPEGTQTGSIATSDPPEHTRLRNFLNWALRRSRVEAMRPRIHELVAGMLDRIEADGGGDLIDGLAAALPLHVVCDILGVPWEEREQFKSWADRAFGGDDDDNNDVRMEIARYFQKLRLMKTENPQDDLISYWTTAVDDKGVALTPWEIGSMSAFTTFAGYDTTAGTIGMGALALLDHPEVVDRLRAEPERWPDAVEEILRRNGTPHLSFRRFAYEDMTIGDVEVQKGDTVLLHLSAAGRDPNRFPEPEVFDLDRKDKKHVAFGQGVHFCSGNELGRMEVLISLKSLFERFPNIKLTVPREELKIRTSPLLPAMLSLPVVV